MKIGLALGVLWQCERAGMAAEEKNTQTVISEIHLAVGMRIKKARQAKGLDQLALATMVGYKHASAITQIEKGTMNASLMKIYTIAIALDKDIVEFFPAWDTTEKRRESENFAATASAALLLPFFARKECADMLRVLAEDVEALPRPGAPKR